MRFVTRIALSLSFLFISPVAGRAEWVSISQALPEPDIRWVAADPKSHDTIYAATEKHVYRTIDGGDAWEPIFTVWGEGGAVRSVYLNPSKSGVVYAVTNRGIWRSRDAGETWDAFYKGSSEASKNVYYISAETHKENQLWLGTAEGIVVVHDETGAARRKGSFPNIPVHAIYFDSAFPKNIIVSAADGIYASSDRGSQWKKGMSFGSGEAEADELQALGIETVKLDPSGANIVQHPPLGRLYTATPQGLCEAPAGAASWSRVSSQNSGNLRIRYLAATPGALYAATDRGVLRWDSGEQRFAEVSDGVPSEETRMLCYSRTGDFLLAATKRGLFKKAHPDAAYIVKDSAVRGDEINYSEAALENKKSLRVFEGEPSIQEVRDAAIEYAEVHPRKIREWREAASRKAWMPSISLSRKVNDNQNIDLDRGGTADPDTFIQGPNEKGLDWSVSASWDLGEIIWNADQTSIDTRSRLMVELRNDVINEVTHLYFERRRLQMEMLLAPAADTVTQMQEQLKLEELTAAIDGLTGGYLSAHLKTPQALAER